MPSGRTHDLVTYALVPVVFIGAQMYWGELLVSVVATAAMLFAGLMFGPDLDLPSRQYWRWGLLRFIWYPYRVTIRHRSRLSHGLIVGTVVRIVYFLIVIVLIGTVVLYIQYRYLGRPMSWTVAFDRVVSKLIALWQQIDDKRYLWAVLAGLWLGAAAHTVIDVIGSIAKKLWRSI